MSKRLKSYSYLFKRDQSLQILSWTIVDLCLILMFENPFVSGQTRSGEAAQESEEGQLEGQNEQLSADEAKWGLSEEKHF